MNKFSQRARLVPLPGLSAWRPQTSCSMSVLAGAGVLVLCVAQPLRAQVSASLPPTALPVLRGVVSGQAVVNAPVPGALRPRMTIDQASQKAIIDWRSFNIGADGEVLFRHPGSTASTLNRIYDANPSVIQGMLSSTGPVVNGRATAGGQVLLINQNGILFNRGAQVNTQSLVASTLNLSNERYLSGTLTSGGLTTPAFAGGYDDTGATLPGRPDGSQPGAIVIGAGGLASAAAPRLQAAPGGSILLFSPRIDNQNGLITAPDGQVMLAAGSKVYLALNEDSNDITLRGFRVEVEAAPDGGGVNITNLIRNAGEISADRGNVSLAALAINQEGRVSAKTAVQSNGSIFLTARTKDSAQSGSVTLKAGSVTEVVPDANDQTTVADSQSYEPYRGVVEIIGRTIENHGSLRVPGGRINLTAADSNDPLNARVYLGAGSETSVAGAWADVDFRKNLQTFRVTSNELKNSPDQKTGVLRGATVTVDLRQDNNILALDGYRGAVQRTAAEKAAVGGLLNIGSTGSVIQRDGAVIDASGGGYRYNGGTALTSKLLGDDGRIYDIATAPQQRNYTQLLDSFQRTYERWNQKLTVANPLGAVGTTQEAYSQGLAGGIVNINSSAGLVLEGTLNGGVTIGTRQLNKAPRGAALRIGEYTTTTGTLSDSQRIGNLTWQQSAADSLGAQFGAGTALTQAQQDSFILAAEQLFGAARQTSDGRVERGFGSLELNTNGRITVPAGVSITTDIGAEVTLRAPQVVIGGDLRVPAGKLEIRPLVPPTEPITPDLGTVVERVTVRTGATLSTAGSWINNASADGSFVGQPAPSARLSADGSTTSQAIDGGNLSIPIDDPLFQARFERGAVLDVGGGASIAGNRRVTGGRGGRLSIANGALSQTSPDWLQADLRGFALANGGELSLAMGQTQITAEGANSVNGVVPSATTRLEADLFADRGFSKVTVAAAGAIDVVSGTDLLVGQQNLVVDPVAAVGLMTGGDLATITTLQTLPDAQRLAASLVLNARAGAEPGASVLNLREGASIRTDPRGEISLSALDGLFVDGSISAPGGKVSATVSGGLDLNSAGVRIGSSASITAAGVFVPTPNDRGLVQGTVVNGGAVTLEARSSGVSMAAGAQVDVSGSSRTIDVATSNQSPSLRQQEIRGQAGTIVVKSQGRTELLGDLVGRGGSAGSAGGSFALEQVRPDGQPTLPDERRIIVTPASSNSVVESGLVDATINVAALTAAGFDKLRLQSENRIEFRESSTLDFKRGIRLDAPLLDVTGDAYVQLQGATVSLGQSLGARQRTESDRVRWDIEGGSASPVLPTRRGLGQLQVDAGTVDLFGSLTINGTALTRIQSDGDVRLIGRPVSVISQTGGSVVAQQTGSLTTAGNVELRAAQVYPATRTSFTVAVTEQAGAAPVADGVLQVMSNGNTPGTVYSAGGKLRLEADTIVQGGTLKAPHGQIDFVAGARIDLAEGSLTSVSGDDVTVPYGSTRAGLNWTYVDGGGVTATNLDTVSAGGKRIGLSAQTIDARPGSTVNLSGGGDVQAAEFVPGNGGDTDITLRDNTFAIIPAARLAAMPFDSDIAALKDPGFGFAIGNGRDAALYDSIQVGAGSAVPAGEYALLPARYALLPDAYLVQLQTGSAYRNLQPGQSTRLANGEVVVAAFRSVGGTGISESQSVGAVISPGSAVRRSSDFNLTGASFFADQASLNRSAAPRAPWDAGRLAIAGASVLNVGGSFDTAESVSPDRTPGRTAEIDIGGSRIAVVDRVGDAVFGGDVLQIAGASLSSLNASVLLGGTREDTDEGIRVTTTASEVIVANSVAGKVTLPELILSARELVDVRAGSALEATGAASGGAPRVIEAESSGALVRLSTGAQARIDRSVANSDAGEVRIADGASLNAAASLLVDATKSTESLGQLRAGVAGGAGGSVSLSSVQVSLGATNGSAGLGGLVLSNADLASFAALDELTLRAYGAMDLLGDATLGSEQLGRLTLDTPLLRGVGAGGQAAQSLITAREFELTNTAATSTAAESGTGTLTARAQTITLGAGDKAMSGFASSTLTATNSVASRGTGSLRAAGELTLDAPKIVAQGGSNQIISAADTSQGGVVNYTALTVTNASAPAAAPQAGAGQLGGRLVLEGKRVSIATEVQAHSGQINVAARGLESDDGVTLASGGVLDARGEVKSFNGTIAAADGGGVGITAANGAVQLQAGSRIDVSAASAAGGAGRIAVRGTSLELAGELLGRPAAGARGGSIELDVATLGSFSALNTALNAGGFAEERQFRVRSGNIDVAAADSVSARRVTLAADAGRIDVSGTVGSGASRGGAQVNLFAADGINLAAGSRVIANGTQTAARGGDVRIATTGGELVFDRTATIDVRAGDAGPAGSVTFGVSRDPDNTIGASRLEGTVERWSTAGLAAQAAGVVGDRPASVDIEATRTYVTGGTIGIAEIDSFAADHAAFIAAASGPAVLGVLRDETGALAGARVLGSTEIRSAGNMTVDAGWDLSNSQWLAGDLPGTLTLRAGGDLTLSQALGSADDSIRAGDTWNLRLAAGADLQAANPLSVSMAGAPGAQGGSLTLAGPEAKLRTGTGRIDLAAAEDVRIESVQSTIYTGGRIGAADVAAGGNDRWAVDGGSISIRAGGSVVGAVSDAGDLWVTEWFRRPRQPNNQFAVLQPTDWWSYRPRFQQGIGTLGGGDIDIVAGANISHLTAVLPTSGRTFRDADLARQVDVQGGGDLAVRAGGDIVGSAFMVGRGTGRVEAAGDIGADRRTQLYVMGTSSGSVPEGASIDAVAGGSLALQTISNPTTLFVTNRDSDDPASGPSFGNQGSFSTFFTYSANSRAGAAAKSGNLSYESVLAPQWRTFNRQPSLNSTNTDLPGAFPASLEFVAFDGDITGPLFADAVTTFPSTSASAVMLAEGSLFNAGFYGSDRAPGSVISPTGNFASANNAARQLDGRALQPTGSQPRIVSREGAAPYVFELQALEGSIVMAGTSTEVQFTAPSRIRAGVDIVGPSLRLQNLELDDLTEVRADSGDFRAPAAVEIRGPGQLLVQAGRNIDLGPAALAQGGAGDVGGLVATGNTANPQLPFEQSARVTVVAGVRGDVKLEGMDAAYAEIITLNRLSNDIIDLYQQLGTESDPDAVLGAGNIAALARRNSAYSKFVFLDSESPRALEAYQSTLRAGQLPLGPTADSAAADSLYRMLNAETDVAKLQSAGSVAGLASLPGGAAYGAYVSLDQRYPLVFSDYVQRRSKGALPTGLTPIVFSNSLADVVAEVVPPSAVAAGGISSYQTSIQTYGGSDIDLWAPGGDIVVGLTTPRADRAIGVLTNAGGAIRSVVADDFNINQGKVITAQGGDILLFSSRGSIDAGRGAKTTLSTPPPVRRPILDADGNQIGVQVVIPASATGSGIQSLTSDPDGLGPLAAPKAGDVYLFAPAGTIDAGEAGIRSSGNIVLNAQTVLNASNISSAGTSAGVPVAATGSLAASVATSGANTQSAGSAADEAGKAAAAAAKAASADGMQKPAILTVEVLGFGDKNCKEQDKDCFAK